MSDGSDLHAAPPEPQAALGAVPEPQAPRGRDLLVGVAIIWAIDLGLGVWVAAASGFKHAEMSPFQVLITTTLSSVGSGLVVWYLVCARYHRSVKEGFALLRPSFKALLLSAAAAVVLGALASAAMSYLSQGKSYMARLASQPNGLPVIYAIALAIPVFEELYYRGFLYPILDKKWGPTAAAILVIAWFTGVHAFQLAGDWIGLLFVLLLGTICTIQRAKSGSLMPAIITHWTYNATLVVISVIQQKH